MSVTLTNPAGMPTPIPLGLYKHVAVATGTRTVTLAGQVGWNSEGVHSSPTPWAASSSRASATSEPGWSPSVRPSTTWSA